MEDLNKSIKKNTCLHLATCIGWYISYNIPSWC